MSAEQEAQSAISDAAEQTGADGLSRKVTVEVVHKQQGLSTTAWAAIGMLLIVGVIGSMFMLSGGDGGGAVGGIFGSGGNCADGIDNDNDGLTDRQDGDCYDEVNPAWKGYNSGHSEDGRNDPPTDDTQQ